MIRINNNVHLKKYLTPGFYLISAIAFVLGFNHYFFDGNLLGNQSIFNLLFLVVSLYLFCTLFKDVKRNIIVPCAIFSFFLSCTMVIGQSLYVYGSFYGIVSSASNMLLSLITIWGFGVFFTCICNFLAEKLIHFEDTASSKPWRIFKYPYLYWIVIFLCWLPCYLAYYPGIFSYDMDSQMPQVLGTVSYSRYHPPLHTFFWDVCLFIEEKTGITGLVIYSIVQMALLSLAFTYLLRFLIKRNVRNRLILLCLLFVCLNPVIAIFSFIPTKDALFAVFFILYSVELCYFIGDKEAYSHNIFAICRLIIFAILSCLLRNNMIYAILLSALIGIVLLKKYWKQLLLWNALIFVGYSLINGPIYNALGIEGGNSREMLSVPIQQISYVVKNHSTELSDEEIEILNKYLPVDELGTLYNPRLADPVKNTFITDNFNEDKGSFLNVWFDLFLRYPDEYISAFLNLNLPYWYIDADTRDAYSGRIYIETYILDSSVTKYDITRDSKIPWLYNIYEKFAGYYAIEDIPIVSNFFSISLPIWVLLLSWLVPVVKKKKECLYIVLPSIYYWLTFLLGPVSNFRYVFPIVALYPLYLVLIMETKKFTKE